jgi:hypothetical protein
MADTVTDRVEQGSSDIVPARRDSVVDPEAILPRFDETGLSEVREVSRDERLGQPQALVNVAHAEFARRQQSQDTNPRRIG